MDISKVSSLLKQHKFDRRRAIQGGAAGLAATGLTAAGLKAASAQDAEPNHKVEFLFVQSFHGGSIEAKDGAAGEYTVTFEHGLGQTVYFSDRPDRLVGTTPTGQFLDGLGFGLDNPPNAAIVFEAGEGTDIAVVELTNPVYDAGSATATYDLKVLENFNNFNGEFHDTATDLDAVVSPFGAAHLFIDSCQDQEQWCRHADENGVHYEVTDIYLGVHGMCWDPEGGICIPCADFALEQSCYDQHPDYCNETTHCIVFT